MLQLTNIICVTVFFIVKANARSVNVDVRAAWPRFALTSLAEVAEFVGEQSKDNFWKFVDAACDNTQRIDQAAASSSQESVIDIQSFAFDSGANLVPKSMHALMETTVGLGAYAPAVRFFEVLAAPYGNPCHGESYVVVYPGGSIHCTYEDIDFSAIDLSNIILDVSVDGEASWDHAYVNNNEIESDVKVILYGALGTSSFCTFHKQLLIGAQNKSYSYSIRYAFPGMKPLTNDTVLQGFGVFLDIKNMEYKTIDDSELLKSSSTDTTTSSSEDENTILNSKISFPEGEEVNGIIFSKLLERKPHLAKELNMLKIELESQSADSTSQDMKVHKTFLLIKLY